MTGIRHMTRKPLTVTMAFILTFTIALLGLTVTSVASPAQAQVPGRTWTGVNTASHVHATPKIFAPRYTTYWEVFRTARCVVLGPNWIYVLDVRWNLRRLDNGRVQSQVKNVSYQMGGNPPTHVFAQLWSNTPTPYADEFTTSQVGIRDRVGGFAGNPWRYTDNTNTFVRAYYYSQSTGRTGLNCHADVSDGN